MNQTAANKNILTARAMWVGMALRARLSLIWAAKYPAREQERIF